MSKEIVIELLNINLEREKKIKELKEADAKLNLNEISNILRRMRSDYRVLLTEHNSYLYDEKIDVDGFLWKTCFYKQIEDFRKSIRKYATQIQEYEAAGTPAQKEKLKSFLTKLNLSFLSFLSDSILFYQDLMKELEKWAKRSISDRNFKQGTGLDSYIRGIQKCLLYLGDLARYRELYSEKNEKEFNEAERYYERASILIPTSGNAHNQLALLATYHDADVIAVYYYCRSALVETPFTAAISNLSSIFEKNVRKFFSLAKTPQLLNGNSNTTDIVKSEKFLTSFLRLHGMLLTWSLQIRNQCKKASALLLDTIHNTGKDTKNFSKDTILNLETALEQLGDTKNVTIDIEEYTSLLQTVLEQFDRQLGSFALTDSVLMRLLIICIFSVHHSSSVIRHLDGTDWAHRTAHSSEEEIILSTTIESYSPTTNSFGTHTITESLALITLFGLITRSAARINQAITTGEKGGKSLMNRILPLISIFSDWATIHTHYLRSSNTSSVDPSTNGSALKITKPSVSGPNADVKVSSLEESLNNVSKKGRTMDQVQDGDETDELLSQTLLQLDDQLSSDQDNIGSKIGTIVNQWKRNYLADRTIERQEMRGRSGLRASLSAIVPILEHDMKKNEEIIPPSETAPNNKSSQYLREHLELRGFLPVADAYEKYFDQFDPFVGTITMVPEEIARHKRQLNIINFVNQTVITLANAEVEERRSTPGTVAMTSDFSNPEKTDFFHQNASKGTLLDVSTGLGLHSTKMDHLHNNSSVKADHGMHSNRPKAGIKTTEKVNLDRKPKKKDQRMEGSTEIRDTPTRHFKQGSGFKSSHGDDAAMMPTHLVNEMSRKSPKASGIGSSSQPFTSKKSDLTQKRDAMASAINTSSVMYDDAFPPLPSSQIGGHNNKQTDGFNVQDTSSNALYASKVVPKPELSSSGVGLLPNWTSSFTNSPSLPISREVTPQSNTTDFIQEPPTWRNSSTVNEIGLSSSHYMPDRDAQTNYFSSRLSLNSIIGVNSFNGLFTNETLESNTTYNNNFDEVLDDEVVFQPSFSRTTHPDLSSNTTTIHPKPLVNTGEVFDHTILNSMLNSQAFPTNTIYYPYNNNSDANLFSDNLENDFLSSLVGMGETDANNLDVTSPSYLWNAGPTDPSNVIYSASNHLFDGMGQSSNDLPMHPTLWNADITNPMKETWSNVNVTGISHPHHDPYSQPNPVLVSGTSYPPPGLGVTTQNTSPLSQSLLPMESTIRPPPGISFWSNPNDGLNHIDNHLFLVNNRSNG